MVDANRTERRSLGIEWLENRLPLDSTIWNQFGQLVNVNSDALPQAAEITVTRDGTPMATGDQVVVSFDVDRTAGFDFRQALVLDTNGFMRVRHLDGESPPRTSSCTDTREEDCFGTSLKLPPGLILADRGAGARFFLTSRVDSVNLNTKLAGHGVLKLEMSGRPAAGPSAADPNTAPVNVHWVLTMLPPKKERAMFVLATRVIVEETVSLSRPHLGNAEAFRAAEFSSSNVDADHTNLGQRTRDADELRVFVHRWRKPVSLNLNSVPRNELIFKDGLQFRGPIQLNQLQPAPLNGDPPNVQINILEHGQKAEYRVQGFVSLNDQIDENSDNLGVWASRSFTNQEIPAGRQLSWRMSIVASDSPLRRPSPRLPFFQVKPTATGSADPPNSRRNLYSARLTGNGDNRSPSTVAQPPVITWSASRESSMTSRDRYFAELGNPDDRRWQSKRLGVSTSLLPEPGDVDGLGLGKYSTASPELIAGLPDRKNSHSK